MDNIDFFHRLTYTSKLREHLLNRIAESTEDEWKTIIEMNCLLLNIDDFESDPKLVEFIQYANCQQRLAIYRFKPNTCYKWHIDHVGRNCCINMLIDGYDSLTLFGSPAPNGQFTNITKLVYEPNKYVLLNVHKFHTVINFSENRYLLSIGVPSSISYIETKQYLMDNNL